MFVKRRLPREVAPLASAGVEREPRKPYQRFRTKAFICDHCSHSFTLKSNLQMHIVNYHLPGSRQLQHTIRCFKCRMCDEVNLSLSS
jgi:hypothetical protein